MAVFEYLRDEIISTSIIDPANSANIISDDLTRSEKEAIANQARISRTQQFWETILW